MEFTSVTTAKFCAAVLAAFGFCVANAPAWQPDHGDGTFINPPLYADYRDPNIIRLGEDFYFATTTFVNSPGITILLSEDLLVLSRYFAHYCKDFCRGTRVAQICNLLYRGFAIRWLRPRRTTLPPPALRRMQFGDTADSKSALLWLRFRRAVNWEITRDDHSKNIRGPWPFHELEHMAGGLACNRDQPTRIRLLPL